jgi:hypothetical protein
MRLLRFGSGAAAFIAGAAMVLAATPALADPGGADIEFTVAGDKIVRKAFKPFYVQIHNKGPETAVNVVVKVDVSELVTEQVAVEPPAGCDVDGAIYTCLLGDLAAGGHDNSFAPFSLTSLTDDKGSAGSFTIEVTSDTPDPNPVNNKETTVEVEVVKRGYDLVALAEDVWAPDSGDEPVQPGERAPLLFALVNHGKTNVHGVGFTVSLPPFVTFPAGDDRRGCEYNAQRTEVTCERPGVTLPPFRPADNGPAFALQNPLEVQVAEDAPGPVALSGGIVAGYAVSESPAGGTLTAAAAQAPNDAAIVAAAPVTANNEPGSGSGDGALTEEVPGDNTSPFAVHTATNPADLIVFDASASGSVGETVTVSIKVKNAGPASSPVTTLKLKAPSGTELVDLPTGCEFETAGKTAKCTGLLSAGEESTGSVGIKIVSATPGSDGRSEISGTVDDPDETNNVAKITVTVGGGGGGLPVTGAKATVIGGTGLAVIAAGAALYILSRRRRVVLVTPSRDA